jgi:hypothetical protein
MRRAAQIVLINGLVFCGLFLSLEVSYRVWLYFRNCDTICRNPAFLTRLDASTIPYGFLVPDPIVGYLPADGNYRIHHPG